MSSTLMAKRPSTSNAPFVFPAPLTSTPNDESRSNGRNTGNSRGRARTSRPSATSRSGNSTSGSRKVKYVPKSQKDIVVTPKPSSKIELISPRRGKKAAIMGSNSAHRRSKIVVESSSESEQEEEKKPPPASPRRGKRDVLTASGHRRRARRDLDPAAIERAAKKGLEDDKTKKPALQSNSVGDEKKIQKVTPSAAVKRESSRGRRRIKSNSGHSGGSRQRLASRSRSPHKAHVLGEFDDEKDLVVDYKEPQENDEDSFAGDDGGDDGDDDDILGVTIDSDGDLEDYMDPGARKYRQRRGGDVEDSSEEDSDDDSEEDEEDDEDTGTERRRSSIFQRFARSTSPARRRRTTAGDAGRSPSKSPLGAFKSRAAKSLSPGTRRRVLGKREDGGSNLRSMLRRSGSNGDMNNTSGGNMMRRLSGPFGNLKMALDGLGGSQHGPRTPNRNHMRTSRALPEDTLDNFDWDEDRQLTRDEEAYLEEMYKEIEELDL